MAQKVELGGGSTGKARSLLGGLGLVVAACLAIMPGVARANSTDPQLAPTPNISGLPIADQIEAIGATLPDGYAGESVAQDGLVTVYVTPAAQTSVASALSAAGVPSSAYQLVFVAHSLDDLEALSQRISEDADSLHAQGFALAEWGLDASSNTVFVKLKGYTPAGAATLENEYGGSGWVSVSPWNGPAKLQLFDRNRYYDTRPFHGGDRIFENTSDKLPKCTSGFTLQGNKSGNGYTTEAGHCATDGLDPVWTNLATPTNRGNVDTNYLTNGDQFDVASFDCNCDNYVWHEGPGIGTNPGSTQRVVGWCDCDANGTNLVTFDGASTGQVPDATVTETNVCVDGSMWPDGRKRCDMNEASYGGTICQPGDSGGPVYQRAANGTIYATGTIVGGFWLEGYEFCYYARIRHILSQLNVSLVY